MRKETEDWKEVLISTESKICGCSLVYIRFNCDKSLTRTPNISRNLCSPSRATLEKLKKKTDGKSDIQTNVTQSNIVWKFLDISNISDSYVTGHWPSLGMKKDECRFSQVVLVPLLCSVSSQQNSYHYKQPLQHHSGGAKMTWKETDRGVRSLWFSFNFYPGSQ